ncbi:hypothetical protein LBRM_23_0550 [Leishmania braziliensis MHOM/BR/75/M2904]|uniref:Uncharacterized protein n=2 Tax=Viannia TaxID=37616 RepID=A4HCR6_LEIBR|nr:hypothetical protein LBRM_23_0550 [Leishmania braziliensis MHOM/BR/75/M2904]CAJ2473168.1 unnamed protein product [Leishmania braziliensis]CAM36562.1 hypothetical protein LBRM_23_0550 [Leishmania braziliensis MHOM/BR/75/M2904]
MHLHPHRFTPKAVLSLHYPLLSNSFTISLYLFPTLSVLRRCAIPSFHYIGDTHTHTRIHTYTHTMPFYFRRPSTSLTLTPFSLSHRSATTRRFFFSPRQKMNAATFTTNPHRIARLQQNYDEGAQREKIPAEQREQMDRQLLSLSPECLSQLFAKVAALQKTKKGKSSVA